MQRKLANGWTAKVVRIPHMEPDSDGPYQDGWTYGVEILAEDGARIGNPQMGVTGPRRAIESIVQAAADRLGVRFR